MNILRYHKNKSDLYATRDGKIVVRDTDYFGESVRVLLVGDTRESATYNAPEKRNELIFEYTGALNRVLNVFPGIRHTLMFGGAGFSYPKYYISHFPERRMDVVEINPDMVDLAMRYFYLKELYAEYRLEETGRLRIIIADGMDYLSSNRIRYDAIFNDAYIGNIPDKGLLSEQGVRAIRNALQPGGVYAINLITALSGPYSMTGVMEQAILNNHFAYTVLLPCTKGRKPTEKQNCVIVASDSPLQDLQ